MRIPDSKYGLGDWVKYTSAYGTEFVAKIIGVRIEVSAKKKMETEYFLNGIFVKEEVIECRAEVKLD